MSIGSTIKKLRTINRISQKEMSEKLSVSCQTISKWETGDCLPDCFNLKAISEIYNISTDLLLETETNSDIDAVANKIEQLGTEFIWAMANCDRYGTNLRQELGDDLWKMWKGIYFAEVGNRELQKESKE